MRVLAIIAAAFSFAVFVCQYALPDDWILYIAAITALAGFVMTAFIKSPNGKKAAAFAAMGAAVGFMWFFAYGVIFRTPAEADDGVRTVREMKVVSFSSESAYGIKADVSVRTGGVPYRAVLYLNDKKLKLHPGDTVICDSLVSLASSVSEETGESMRSRGYYAFVYQRGDFGITAASKTDKVLFFPKYAARTLSTAADRVFSDKVRPIMKALVLGDRSELYNDKSLTSALSLAGIYHIVAISGMHVSFLVSLISFFIGKRKRTYFIVIPVLAAYAVMTGLSPSVVRAVIMQMIVMLAAAFDREDDPITSLLFALMIILTALPYAAGSISLQLSFAAMLGLILLSGRVKNALTDTGSVKTICEKRRNKRIIIPVINTVSATLGTLVFTVPLTALYFGRITFASVITNTLCFFPVSLCFGAGLLACLAGVVFVPAGAVFGVCADVLARFIIAAAKLVSRWRFGSIYTSNIYVCVWIVLMYIVIAILIICRFDKKTVKAAIVTSCALLCAVLLMTRITVFFSPLRVTALDVGQGQCIVFSSSDKVVVVDCGGAGSDSAGTVCADYLLGNGYTSVDMLILSHFDVDHTSGVYDLCSRIKVRQIAMPDPAIADTDSPDAVQYAAEKFGCGMIYITSDVALSCGNMSVSMFVSDNASDENDSGIVALISEEGYDVLVMGDVSQKIEKELVTSRNMPDIEVLVTGHHGSVYSTGSDLLQNTRPEIAVISVGYNTYGHPSEKVVKRLEGYGVTVLRTDLEGNITLTPNGRRK